MRWLLVLSALPASASATVPECSGVRIAADAACEQRVEVGCASSCALDDLISACAADLAASCRAECDFDADIRCTNDCDATCEERCRIDDVRCDAECATACVDQCADADDPRQCRASCESTCGAECDAACGELPVDATCQQHCEECCFGSCSAQVNFGCPIGCQGSAFAQCQEALASECNASCGVGGTVCCDGQFVAGSDEVAACSDALEARGVDVEVSVDVADPRDALGLCSVAPQPRPAAAWLLGWGRGNADMAHDTVQRRAVQCPQWPRARRRSSRSAHPVDAARERSRASK